MKFKFRLEKVLHVRKMEEDEARNKVLHRQKELREEEERLQVLRRERQDVLEFGRSQDDLVLRAAAYQYLERLENRIHRQQQVVADCEVRLRQARSEFFTARQKKKVLENLRARRYEEFVIEQQRAEQKVLDDIGARVRA